MRISDWSSDVCSSDLLLLDPAADEVEILFEFGLVAFLRRGTGDHDLLDFGAGALRLLPDDGDVDGHLTPAIDGVARVDDLRLDDGAAGFLRAEIRARQEDHADGEAVGQRLVAGIGDGVVEEAHRQVDMDARAVAGLTVCVDRAAVPDGLERVDGAGDDAAAGTAVRGGDQTDAAGVAFKFRAIHAFGGEAEAFGFHMVHVLTFQDAADIAALIRASILG